MITLKELSEKFTQVAFEDNNYKAAEFETNYYENLPEDLGKGTNKEIADRVHKYDELYYRAFREDAGNRIVDTVIADTDREIGNLELVSEVSGLKFTGAWSRPVGDEITKKDYQNSFGFGYGMSKQHTSEKKQLKTLAERLFDALEEADKEEE